MRKLCVLLVSILLLLVLAACEQAINGNTETQVDNPSDKQNENVSMGEKLVEYSTFERALLLATDAVVANYVTHRDFGRTLVEFEFKVSDRVLGNAADIIYVYTERAYASIMGSDELKTYNEADVRFDTKTDYLLALTRLEGAHLKTHEDGYLFIQNLVIDLDNPTLSTMYNESISKHASELDFNSRSLKKKQILTFIEERTKSNTLAREHIRSDKIEDIINGSQYVLIVEINEPLRPASAQASREWMETDIYYCTVIKSIKGDIDADAEVMAIYFADTVKKGEQHIIAVEQRENNVFLLPTSKNSLFRMDQLDEIMKILELR
ncbi:MAG: hypothetical protein FWD44_02740 [Oscillospiraceae bacterium]|nr:hypothetical protein [Oscillospiraceae bacterium]